MSFTPHRPTVVLTDGGGPGRSLAAQLQAAGAVVRVLPVVSHGPAPDPAPLARALARLPEYAWAAFTSARAVDAVCQDAAWTRWPWVTAPRPRVAAVGPATRAVLLAHGIPVALCPDVPGARPLAQAMIGAEGGSMSGRTVFWPRSSIARPDLGDALLSAGAALVAPVVYCTASDRPPGLAEFMSELQAGRIDCVTFLAPSGAAALAALMPGETLMPLARLAAVASIGPATSAALAALGAPPAVEAPSRTAGGLATALLSYLGLSQSHTP